MKTLFTLALIVTLLVPFPVAADVVTEWNELTTATAMSSGQGGLAASRTTALVHAAIFDAVNAIDGRYAAYKVSVTAPAGALPEAAAAAAAHAALTRLYPTQRAALDQALDRSLARLPDGPARRDGLALGARVGADMVALRASDGAFAPYIYRPVTAPGVWIPTTAAVGAHWGSVTPWVMERGSQFRPGPPPALSSVQWARDCEEIRDFGGKVSTARTAEQTEIGRFWAVTGPASWDPMLRAVAAAPGRTVLANARLFALAQMAAADAYVAVFDAKYTYNLWRPITALRNGDAGGNGAMKPVADWEPLVETPMHPEYPCAHCITSAAIAAVLDAELGPSFPEVALTSPTAPGATRRWSSGKGYTDEISMARIYGGVHYRNSTVVGQQMGRQIGEVAVRQYLRPR